MGRKGTSRKPSTKSGAGESQAPRSAVASTRKRQSTRSSQPDPAQPPMDDAAARRYGHFVIAVTLIAIAVPVVIAVGSANRQRTAGSLGCRLACVTITIRSALRR